MMKKLFYIILGFNLFVATTAEAKKVKFAVDMRNETVSVNGVHVSGDFQTIAGYSGGDWQPNTTKLIKSTIDTNIYSLIVEIPAFRKYEYKFVNGDQFYESEFVPVESRISLVNDNRWIYVDSLSDDTTFVGAVTFSGNAPKGLNLLRLSVDVKYVGANKNRGVHVIGSFQNLDPRATILYSFGSNVYEVISYVDTGNFIFKYVNGDSMVHAETVPAACAANGFRNIMVSKDTVLPLVCFASCEACVSNAIERLDVTETVNIYPNPAKANATIKFEHISLNSVIMISDIAGRTVSYIQPSMNGDYTLVGYTPGIYIVRIQSGEAQTSYKLVIQ